MYSQRVPAAQKIDEHHVVRVLNGNEVHDEEPLSDSPRTAVVKRIGAVQEGFTT
ncbi:hypothetical protein H0H93_010909 [Arthromyces matolae]|nr:hypothetical protein H0H93_010909 [Arthromyces matolae]